MLKNPSRVCDIAGAAPVAVGLCGGLEGRLALSLALYARMKAPLLCERGDSTRLSAYVAGRTHEASRRHRETLYHRDTLANPSFYFSVETMENARTNG